MKTGNEGGRPGANRGFVALNGREATTDLHGRAKNRAAGRPLLRRGHPPETYRRRRHPSADQVPARRRQPDSPSSRGFPSRTRGPKRGGALPRGSESVRARLAVVQSSRSASPPPPEAPTFIAGSSDGLAPATLWGPGTPLPAGGSAGPDVLARHPSHNHPEDRRRPRRHPRPAGPRQRLPQAVVKHRTKPEAVDRVLARRHNWPGARELRRFLWGDEPVTLSRLESSFIAAVRRARLPLPETNRPADARYVDCRWPEHRLTVELDGYAYHATRHAWERDLDRERRAHARGDEFRRYSWRDVVEVPEPMLRPAVAPQPQLPLSV
jgi:hypothetical protein